MKQCFDGAHALAMNDGSQVPASPPSLVPSSALWNRKCCFTSSHLSYSNHLCITLTFTLTELRVSWRLMAWISVVLV